MERAVWDFGFTSRGFYAGNVFRPWIRELTNVRRLADVLGTLTELGMIDLLVRLDTFDYGVIRRFSIPLLFGTKQTKSF
ncbi:uncharacterized protein J3R85_010829 [Psidium guajava]|nr:uncharacterized protein J3R85_010829 [Psidium guajava]